MELPSSPSTCHLRSDRCHLRMRSTCAPWLYRIQRERDIATLCAVALVNKIRTKTHRCDAPQASNLVGYRAGWRRRNSSLGAIFGRKRGVRLLRARVSPCWSPPIFILLTPVSTYDDIKDHGAVLRPSQNGPKKSQKVSADKY
jgi:hypothetical protein